MATIREILREGYGDYEKRRHVPKAVRRAVYSQLTCRTEDSGFHAEYCPDWHYVQSHYNSCRHRMCPECGFMASERWLRKRKAALLRCNHYHLIITLPHLFNEIWLYNVEAMSELLFSCAMRVVRSFLDDERFLGATPGIIAALHTWAQTLILHAHLHFLISAGGLTATGEWRDAKRDFLLPIKKAMWDFRELFCDEIVLGVREGRLKLPAGMSNGGFERLIKKARRRKWNVYIKESYKHGQGVATYLANYLRGGPISNKRILSLKGGIVTFNYADAKDKGETKRGKIKRMPLPMDQFLQRYLQHTPVPNFHTVRYYGIYSSSAKKKLDGCRSLIGQAPVEDPQPLNWQEYLSGRTGKDYPTHCPECGQELQTAIRFAPKVYLPLIKIFLMKPKWN
jgi:Putative transposase/Transposase zinc-binding domain